eukprot:679569-Pyramimonas_sp.AAC.1
METTLSRQAQVIDVKIQAGRRMQLDIQKGFHVIGPDKTGGNAASRNDTANRQERPLDETADV